jgi:hypothetical protein
MSRRPRPPSSPWSARAAPALGLALLAAAAVLGCAATEEGFEAELHLTSAANQSPFTDVGRLEITFRYDGSEAMVYSLDAPFDGPPVLEDLPRAEAGEVEVVVRGQEQDASADGGWRTVADGTAAGFAMPPEEPIAVHVLMKGQIALMDGRLDSARGEGRAILLDDGRVVVIGGADGETTVPAVEVLLADPTDSYRGEAVNELPRMAHTAFLVQDSGTGYDGQVVIVGGDTECGDFVCFSSNADETVAREVMAFDPEDDSLEEVDTLVYGRIGGVPALMADGRWAIVGGFDEDGGYPVFPYIFDPDGGGVGWADGEADGREQHTCASLDVGNGKVLIAGGIVNDELQTGALLWSDGAGALATGSLGQGRMRHTTTLLPDGRALFVGGATGQFFDAVGSPLDSVEIYDPDSGEFAELAPGLDHARQRHVAVPLSGGTDGVLICGGVDQAGDGATPVLECEVYSTTTGAFESRSGLELVEGGEGMMAVPLDDGSVLLMGGLAAGQPLDAVHLYYP